MTKSRQDAWSKEEDVKLAEVVLRHIREGGTQLAAFEEVGKRLNRTAAACGFRWNSQVRKQYESAIALAKKQRKLPEPSTESEQLAKAKDKVVAWDDAITYLETLRTKSETAEQLLKENERLKRMIDELKNENHKLVDEMEKIRKEKLSLQSDYKVLMDIMERARKNVDEEAGQK
ncbi:MAG TPA: RsfA family transcriptional regulator [Bacillales bacterium]|nr:RsfA family transcriptional regulator [Bacillales bacterium]